MKIFLLLILAIGCGRQGTHKLYKIEKDAMTKFVNQKSMPQEVNTSLDKLIVNNSYPIEIALYKDNSFYYNLANLGDGRGTWDHSGGKIKLKAKRTLFNMYIDIHGSDETAENLTIQFTDRFGANTLKMMNINL